MITEGSKGLATDSHVIAKPTLIEALGGEKKNQSEQQNFIIISTLHISHLYTSLSDFLIDEQMR